MIIKYTLPQDPQKKLETDLDKIVLGRNPKENQHVDLDLQPDGYVSHVHARLSREADGYWIEDLQSENGTFIEGTKIQQKTKVRPGEEIRIGKTIIEIGYDLAYSIDMESEILPGDETDIDELSGSAPSEDKWGETVVDENLLKPDETTDSNRTDISYEDEESKESGSEGTITTVKDAFLPPFTQSEDEKVDESQQKSWQQLKALNEFVQALGANTTIEGLGSILVDQLKGAIPNAQRGALLLPDANGKLLLKAHWPRGEHSVSMTWVKRAFTRKEAFIWSATTSTDSSDDAPKSALYYDVQSAIYVPLMASGELFGVIYVDNYLNRDAFSITDFELLRAIGNQVAMFLRHQVLRKDLEREETLKSNLLRQYSPKVAELILHKANKLQRGGEQVEPVTILVSDIRNFTVISAKMEPDEVVRAINEMFDAFVPIISDQNGIVDKYVGDSVLAVFGSPEKDPQQWEKAVCAAIKMQEAIQMLGEGRKIRRLPVFNVGIGIHTGAVIHGFIGSSERIEFTVIGDTVNLAARHCDGAGPGEIVISKKVYERVYPIVDVIPKTIITKHPDVEPDLEAYTIKGLKSVNGYR